MVIELTKTEAKWQKKWENAGIFNVKEDPKKKKFYCLEMYPYPSGSGLHMGHARNYVIGDVYARYKRMNGFNVLYPMGYDSFGLPAENAAIKAKSHPKIFTEKAIASFIKQQKALGLSYDWDRQIASHSQEYYRWDQWIFLKMYEKGLVYKKKSIVNWCPECNTVLANEQVHNGKCWRHTETNVEVKDLVQWFLKITKYAEELLSDIDKLDGWAEDVKTMQKNWIGKSQGTNIHFDIEGSDKKLSVFTTRPDTYFGITYLVYAPEHPDVMELVSGTEYEDPVKEFVRKVVLEDRFMRTSENTKKEGLFIGRYAINPITKDKIPIYIANFVLYEYGTGAIIAVPAHDQRDFEFAKKYNIPIKVVINPADYEINADKMSRAFMGDGILTNSGEFDGMNNREAIEEITTYLKNNNCGEATTEYKLRDWLISRQRFWGCPIPIIYCNQCGIVPVPETDLPVVLPEDFSFKEGTGNPLQQCEDFVNTNCPNCNAKAKRETDTMDTFIDSSWYFLRYCDAHNTKLPFAKEKADYWMPIDMYIGGKEHATMHLIYFRFFTKFLRDIGLVSVDEPTNHLFNQGMLHKGGHVMSKSRGNVVTQEEISEKYGIDTARFFLMFVAGPEKDMEWDDQAVEGSFRFLKKVASLVEKTIINDLIPNQESKNHKTIMEVTNYIQKFAYNQALISIMSLANYLYNQDSIQKSALESLIKMMAPFTPHLAEEMWQELGNEGFVSVQNWPEYDETKINTEIEAGESLLISVNKDILSVLELAKISKPKKITLIVAPDWKFELFRNVKKLIATTRDVGTIIKSVMVPEYGSEISKLVPKLAKDPSKIPNVILDPAKEEKVLQESNILKEYQCDIVVINAQACKDSKAKNALPGKPAIIAS